MGNNKDLVSAGKPKVGGAVFKAPKGTTVPTDAVSSLAEAYVSAGYCSEDGVTNSNSITVNDVKAWGGDIVLSAQTEKKDTFKFKLIEGLNPEVLKIVHGEKNVEGNLESGISVKVNSDEHDDFVWVVDMIMKGGILKRIVFPSAAVTAIEDVAYQDSGAIGYGITLTAHPDKDGNTHYEYISKPTNTL